MRWVVTLAVVAVIATMAMAQHNPINPNDPNFPRTVPFQDRAGNTLGTATIVGNRMILRDKQGDLIAQVVFEPDGTKKYFDPYGKAIDRIPYPN